MQTPAERAAEAARLIEGKIEEMQAQLQDQNERMAQQADQVQAQMAQIMKERDEKEKAQQRAAELNERIRRVLDKPIPFVQRGPVLRNLRIPRESETS